MSWSHARRQLIVAAVCILITFVAYTSQIFVLWNFLGGATLHTVFVLAPFNAFVIMIYINYTLVCLTDPGTVPPNWMPDPEAAMEVKRSTHAPRFCKTCKNYKPPRTHHCSTCGRCVLKMDHHCPWISNCVGFANYGHFIRFIVYVEISCIYLFIMLSCRLAQIIRNMHLYNLHPTTVEAVFLAANLLMSAAAIITVGILNGYHAFCLTTNTTTIEGWEKGTTLTMKSLGRIRKVKYPYNLGLYRNICAVLGQQPILWLWPQRMKGDGLSFPTKEFDNTSNDDEEIGDDDDEKLYQGHGMDDDFSADDHHHLDHRSSIYTLQTMQSNDNEISEAMSTTSAEEKRQSVVSLPKRVHTRISGATLRVDPSWPTTPASVTTFASSTTLVDSQWKLPTRASKETFELGSSSRRSR